MDKYITDKKITLRPLACIFLSVKYFVRAYFCPCSKYTKKIQIFAPQGGLEIWLKLKFEHTNVAVVEVMKEKLARYNYEFDENNINHQADIVSYSSAEENEPENE